MKSQSINNMTQEGRLSCEMIISDKNAGVVRLRPWSITSHYAKYS
jgi:hypothetical protein